MREKFLKLPADTVGTAGKDIAISEGGLGFAFRAGQIGRCVDNGSPPR